MKRLIIFDFDDTLFDTYGFYSDVLVRLNKLHGLDMDQFDSESSNHFLGSHGAYDFLGHLKSHLKLSQQALSKQLVGQLPRQSYVFDDAATAIDRLSKMPDTDIVVLTVGLRNWQQTKFRHAPEVRGIRKVLIMEGKGIYLKRLAEINANAIKVPGLSSKTYQKVYLVDDNLINFEGLTPQPKNLELIRIRRPGAKHATIPTPSGIKEIASLDELI